MLEVFTIGGGEYLVNVFNAVAAWSGGGGYRALIRVALVMGLIYALLVVAFTLNYRSWFNWFLQATAIYLCLMVPTIDIKVTDRLNPALAPATVDNVPLGLGVLASFTSQVGDYLTRTAETVFSMPSELNYSGNGMVYGSRLLDATRNFEIRDAEFATNLEEHFKSCTFYDLMLGFKSMTDLSRAADLWATIGPGSEARSQKWVERQSDGSVETSILTCRTAYQALDAQWTPMIEANLPIWGREAFPRLSNALAADKLRHDVPVVAQAFTGGSPTYASVLRQNTAINAFAQARNGMAGGSGAAAIDTFATTRADIQARNTYNSIAQQAMAWVPVLHIVLTVVFYAMFPVIFPLFLMPQTGVAALKGYATGFFYLAAWGPLYVVLHMICMTRAEMAATGIAGGGVTLGTFAGIGAVNAETATIAGFMLMSVPFLAAGLARGAMGIASHSMSMLAPAQNAAEQAAAEQTTGNYSYGNVSAGNWTSNMRQSNQWQTAASYMSGAAGVSVRQDNGATVGGFGNGRDVIDTSAAISRLQFTPTMNTGTVAEWRELASEAERQAESFRNAASSVLTAQHRNAVSTTLSHERTSGSEASAGVQSGTSVEQFDRRTTTGGESIEQRSSESERAGVTDSRDRRVIVSRSVGGSLNAGTGAGRGGQGPAPQAQSGQGGASQGRPPAPIRGAGSVSVGANADQQSALGHQTQRSRSAETQNSSGSSVRDDHASGSGASSSEGTYERAGSFNRSSTTSSDASVSEDSLALAHSYTRSAERLDEIARSLNRDASYAESHGMQLSENLSQDLAQWYRREQARNPGMDVPELWATDLSYHQQSVRAEMIARWMDERSDVIRAEIDDYLVRPNMVDIERPDVSSSADVRGRYAPARVGGGGGAPSARGIADADAIIDAGRAELEDRRAAARAGRNLHVEAGSQVRQEVQDNQDIGFFNDPDLRK
ncbi:conjugal transfer protein TraG N-terminal domain-containing protein [Sphingobium sp. AS12]|uniref:conjugal transfer protein TraG N-terminal domain-containing protein n=1 Tax=Sphingobium sp. AS12 TaxID=2849495 RepID=UPI001C31E53A|nr:conjugal transfer protein TraG N-terminal domain-containing protein [Sphingobium sp. AS12]MBV2149970.1 conjugal transfer protein TraG N-terminal domain-containing protein [Sphingobium sp. AS12]